jgi:hypothetical protein
MSFILFFLLLFSNKKDKNNGDKKNRDKIVLYNGVEDKVIVYVCS